MNSAHNSDVTRRLVGQQLTSVLVAIDCISLKFVKYPLSEKGEFSDSANVDIEEGYEAAGEWGALTIRKDNDLNGFRIGAIHLIALIGQCIEDVKPDKNGGLELYFDSNTSVRLLVSEQGFDSFDLTFKR
ncbi:hypothetical protein G4G28_06055 [Massilia sp. Dwa41.01b]|uniref:hypothetical protein n=1 Tax=unclassified Massilia TaxID=2609279 RepID=UPI00160348A4|nr:MULTISPECIES: hypothetical protein [unclassified Massilia]QNA88166.1 hypothetical protein G4G28_06055 [Massilia sp. Dwa41.01b]QNA99072.1 hypothetical protein G4G31_09780 [Massilia sp. Se16.2.3]